MVGNPKRWRAVIPQLESRNSTAGCLLALLLFLPILSKVCNVSMNVITLFAVIYVSIIVPIGTGFISRKDVIGKIRSLKEKPWTRLYHEKKGTEFIKLTAAFVIVRLGKGVAISLAILTVSYQFTNFEPNFMFIFITFTYFCFTQYQNSDFIKRSLVDGLSKLELPVLDGLEENWVPVFIYSASVAMSMGLFVELMLHTDRYIITLFLGYFNILLPVKFLLQPAWSVLNSQKAIISKFSLATWSNPEIRGGYPCAICLDKMRFLMARTTPCGHVFHGSCLRKCLHHSKLCPLCKSPL
ncbi:hypothetical protein RUM44_004522 [Polyplax serrata]|uniref:RING-type domain-containing protein n=1 Tax=Polyplax serrata TaxID=468196 RepID=A0ABR1B338_POLSC